MPATQLLEFAKRGDFDAFETRCLELIEGKAISLAELVGPIRSLDKATNAQRIGALIQVVLENADLAVDVPAALSLARVALHIQPDNASFRQAVINLYRRIYGETPDFEAALAASGLTSGRPARQAVKLLDYTLALNPGDTVISRADDRVFEIGEIDRGNGLFTLRRESRTMTLPASDVAREYDVINPEDFRVLRQLRGARVVELIENDPVAVVVGLLHAHGQSITAEGLKDELVPRYIPTADWSKWWTRARTLLKRSPNVTVEGRTPVILTYSALAQTLESETWQQFAARKDPKDWLAALESYRREKTARKEPIDPEFLKKCAAYIAQYLHVVKAKRPAEALACALVIETLEPQGVAAPPETREVAATLLRESNNPGSLIASLEQDALWERAFATLKVVLPDGWAPHAVGLLPRTRAGLLELLVESLLASGETDPVQKFIDEGLTRPTHYPELVYWLWKGTKSGKSLRLPPTPELFGLILNTLSGLVRTTNVPMEVIKEFRARMKSALGLRDYAQVKACLEKTTPEKAITLRRQLDRLDGLGENARAKMLDLLRDVHPHLWVEKMRVVAPWEDTTTIWCTQEGLQRRTGERDDLVNVEMRENAKHIGEAASLGDLSENSEYKFALEERDLLRARLARINEELALARPFSAAEVPSEHVGVGTRVRLRDVANDRELELTFLGPFETDVEKGIYSYLAPFSQRLMGLHIGDRAKAPFDGRDTEFEILSIANALAYETVGAG